MSGAAHTSPTKSVGPSKSSGSPPIAGVTPPPGQNASTTITSPASSSPPTSVPSPPSPSPVAAWDLQYRSAVTTLQGDVSTVEAAEPTSSGDYTDVVGSWEQLASDVSSAQALPAVPDATVEANWSDALEELAGAVVDWLGSLTSTAPPSGTIADQAQFDSGNTLFAQGVTDLATAATAVAAG
jgi:hypothetical protein